MTHRMIGQTVQYTLDGRTVEGLCTDARPTGTTIVDTTSGEEWWGIQFQLATDHETFWTVTYPDHDAPLVRPKVQA
jgi:hypothetical protein